jgi:hypothetical protein
MPITYTAGGQQNAGGQGISSGIGSALQNLLGGILASKGYGGGGGLGMGGGGALGMGQTPATPGGYEGLGGWRGGGGQFSPTQLYLYLIQNGLIQPPAGMMASSYGGVNAGVPVYGQSGYPAALPVQGFGG